MANKTKVLQGDAYITNVKATTGVVSLADKVQDITSGKILDFDVFHTSGEQADKISWFKITGFGSMNQDQRRQAVSKFEKAIGTKVPIAFTTPSSDEENSKFYNIEFL